MSSIKNKAVFFFLFFITSCDGSFDLVNQTVDYFFIKNRIKTFCARSIIELYELSLRINDKKESKDNFFFTSFEVTALQSMEEDIKKIYSDHENTKKGFDHLLSIEDKIKQKLKRGDTLNSCINSIEKNKKCNQSSGRNGIDCINKAQRLFTIEKMMSSKVTSFFPKDYLEQVNQEKSVLKNYFQN